MGRGSVKLKSKKVIILPERCKGCGFCIEFCPQKLLIESAENNVKGYRSVCLIDRDKCTKCDICGMVCPDFAISVVDTEE